MELWIRSQDRKRLTKVEDIYMVEDKNNFTSYIGNNVVGHLGEYKKVGRALEVLEEIQNILKPKGIIKFNSFISCADAKKIQEIYGNNYSIFSKDMELLQQVETCIYEMPEE